MTTRGRPRKPKAETLKAGKGCPACPSFLRSEGKAEWKRVTAELQNMGILATVDRAALTAYCEAWEDFVALLKEYQVKGATVETIQGNTIQHPILGAKNKAAERLIKIAAQFGMTPAAREKIEVKEKGGEGDFAKFANLRVAK